MKRPGSEEFKIFNLCHLFKTDSFTYLIPSFSLSLSHCMFIYLPYSVMFPSLIKYNNNNKGAAIETKRTQSSSIVLPVCRFHLSLWFFSSQFTAQCLCVCLFLFVLFLLHSNNLKSSLSQFLLLV